VKRPGVEQWEKEGDRRKTEAIAADQQKHHYQNSEENKIDEEKRRSATRIRGRRDWGALFF